MLKSLEIRITSKCNSRCLICHIWKTSLTKKDASLTEYRKLFSHPEFKSVEEIFISGGEPFCRPDLQKTVLGILKLLPKVNCLFLTTNGTFPKKAASFFQKINQNKKITSLRLGVSLEGDRETNKKIRGIDTYDSALRTLVLCKKIVPQLQTRILATLTKYNCNKKSLNHLLSLAKKTDSAFSFRPFYNCDYCHYNYNDNLSLTRKQKLLAADFINKNLYFDPFLVAQIKYLKTGEMPFMDKCLAGSVFADVRQNASVYACLNSSRKIGNPEKGIFVKKIIDLGQQEPCPCCDEGCFYSNFNNKKSIRKNL